MESTQPPTLTRSSSSAKAMAALTTLASQAKGLTSVLQRPKFLTTLEVRAPSFQLQRKPELVSKSHSSSAATSASDDLSDEVEERRSVDETTASSSTSSSLASSSAALPRRSRLESEDNTSVLLPWELRDELGDVVENAAVREKVFELTMYRRTFVEDADGEDDYTFQYAKYKDVARRLLLSDPNLRDKYTTIVESPMAFIISEETFWRNFFLRCNAIRVAADLPPYLPPVVLSSMPAVASFQRFRRDMFLKTQRSSAELEKLRRSLLQPKRPTTASMDESDLMLIDCELGDLELDLDGEIERELMRRRPSRAVEYRKNSKASVADAVDAPQERMSEVAP